MTTTSQATAAPVTLRLGGDEYRMSPLAERDYGELERWLQARALRFASESSRDLPAADRRDVLDAAMRHAQGISIASAEGQQALKSLDGISMMLWLGLRSNHPDLTHKKVQDLLLDKETQKANQRSVEEAMQAFDLANDGVPAVEGEKDPKAQAAQ